MKYLKKFQTNADYQAFKSSGDWFTPNVSVTEENNGLFYNSYVIKIITFKASGLTLQAIDGMTWREWVNSEYNTCGASISEYVPSSGSTIIVTINGASSNGLCESDIIIADYAYHFSFERPDF